MRRDRIVVGRSVLNEGWVLQHESGNVFVGDKSWFDRRPLADRVASGVEEIQRRTGEWHVEAQLQRELQEFVDSLWD